jgi:hypothetical protein
LTLTDNGTGSATLSGTPNTSNIGTHSVILSATDGTDNTSQSFSIIVSMAAGGNNAPVFSSTAVTSGIELQAYTYNITTSDADGDNLTISATTIPSWLTLADNGDRTAMLTGTPASSDIGTHVVLLDVNDGTVSATQSFNINVSAADGSSNASDLFFSEYIEGSSFNKGLEIANFTGSSIDLSIYSIQKQTNGAGDWGSELALTGNIAQGDVFTVVNTSADQVMLDQADIVTGAGSVTFNGNDPVGLFKNGTLIDILGTLDNANNFAQNITLTRKSNISNPKITYDASEWDTHASNTFSFFGTHVFEASNETCAVPTALSADNITTSTTDLNWSAPNSVSSYNIQYKLTSSSTWTEATSNTTSISITGLDANSPYEFQVQSICTGTTSQFSSSANFTTKSVVTSLANDANIQFNLYPNPAINELIMDFENIKVSKFLVSIINATGETIYLDNEFGNKNIDISFLNTGIYYLRIIHGEKVLTKKFIKF